MNDNDGFGTGFILGIVLALIVIFCVWAGTHNRFKTEAVKNGCAKWVVSVDGDTTFKWVKIKENAND